MAEIGASSYRRFPQEDNQALGELISAYSDSLVRFAYSFVRSAAAAEDIAAESIAVFLLKKKHFPDEDHMRAYLYKIVRNRSMDHLRRHQSQIPLEDVENVLGSGDPESDVMTKWRDQTLYRCLQALPDQYRQALQLSYLDGFSVRQICAVMHRSAKQVYNLLSRGRSALKELLEKEGITYEDL